MSDVVERIRDNIFDVLLILGIIMMAFGFGIAVYSFIVSGLAGFSNYLGWIGLGACGVVVLVVALIGKYVS
jgi:amino acid transporter